MELRNKANFKFVVDGVDIPLYIVQNFELGGSNSIIINESATGNSGVSYNMGRLHEEIPINGTLLGIDKDDVMNKVELLFKIKDNGDVVQFVTPYSKQVRSNQYFIKDVKFMFNEGMVDVVPFSMLVSENRDANVKIIQANLVNFSYSEFYKDYYSTITGDL